MSRVSSLKLQKLLLIEDEPGLVMTLTDLLDGEGYNVEAVQDGQKGLEMASTAQFDLVILDIMLPGMNGLDVCRNLRRRGIRTPVLMLTARGQTEDKVSGLKIGADDYLTKPFAIPELLARLQALLRRASAPEGARSRKAYQFGSVVVDFRSTEVRKDEKRLEISAREFELLCYLIEHRGATISRRQLLREVWGYEPLMLTRTVDVHFGLLRQKLETDPKNPRHFLTVRGIGYKFADESESENT